MKVIVCHRYGSPDSLKLKEVQKPTPKDEKIQAASANPGDLRLLGAEQVFRRLVGYGFL